MTQWTPRTATAADRDGALSLLRRAFADTMPISAEYWEWLFLRNPAAAGLRYVVADTGTGLAGQYATLPVRLSVGGRELLALVSLHTATDPEYAGRGIFSSLARNLYDGAESDAALVFGFPNEASAPVFFNRLGWVRVEPFPLLVRPLGAVGRTRTARAAALAAAVAARGIALAGRLRSRPMVHVITEFGSWADVLWESLRASLGTCVVRDRRFLTWRFVEAPFDYRILAVGDGQPRAFAVVGMSQGGGERLAYLMELMAPADDTRAARALAAAAVRVAQDEGAAALVTFATRRHPHRRALLTAGFVRVPRRFRAGFAFGVRPFPRDVDGGRVRDIDEWHLSPADLDYV